MRIKIKNAGVFLLAVILCVTMLPVNVLAVKEETNGNYKFIALTFDDGPSKYTSELLDALAARGAKATFFCAGTNAQRYPDLLKRIAGEGHQLANHTYSHKQLTKLPAADMKNEINGCRNLLVAAGGENTYYIRPPYGSYNDTLKSVAGAPLVLWSVDPEDWKYRDADVVTNNIMSTVKDGDIVLLHDLYKTSVEAAIRVVDKLQAEGYEFVTVKELLRRRGVEAENGGVYSKARNNGMNLGPLVYEMDGPVAEEHWAYSAAQFVIENGYFPDLSFQNFSPERHITRGMFVAALSRMAGADGEGEVSVTFADVTADMPEAPYISFAAEIGLVDGYGDGTFGTNDLLSREEAVVMIDRLLHYLAEGEIDGENPIVFADADKISSWAKESVERCVSFGIIHGDDLGKFNPASRTTRAQAAIMIQAAAASLKAAAEQKEKNENAAENPEDAGYFDNVNQTLIRYCTSIGPMNREDVLNYNPLRKTTSQQMLILLTCLSILIFRK